MKKNNNPLILSIIIFFVLFNIVTAIVFYYIFKEAVNLKHQIILSVPATILYFVISHYISRKKNYTE
jgi:phosphate starvation-inducible membrane PsiE